jgi:hypothetical protein
MTEFEALAALNKSRSSGVRMFELPKTIPDVKMLLGPEELGSTILFLLKKVDFKSFNANGAIVRCPLAVQ